MLRSELGTPPNRSIFLDNVVCSGGETDLTQCSHTTTDINCDRSEEAGVRCGGILTSQAIRVLFAHTKSPKHLKVLDSSEISNLPELAVKFKTSV